MPAIRPENRGKQPKLGGSFLIPNVYSPQQQAELLIDEKGMVHDAPLR
jgi:hypothetical protein